MHVGLDRGEHLGLEQQPGQAEPLDRVLLHHLDDADREERADIAEPARDPGGRRAQASLALGDGLEPGAFIGVVQGAERGVDPRVVAV